jgi:hypothetical protein
MRIHATNHSSRPLIIRRIACFVSILICIISFISSSVAADVPTLTVHFDSLTQKMKPTINMNEDGKVHILDVVAIVLVILGIGK